jgi:putative ABC transport system permease protein
MFAENLKIALRAIFANKLRSTLTVLGVMVGVAAVIAVVSLVQGLQYQISQQLENVGSTFIRVIPDFSASQRNPFIAAPTLTYDDAVAVRRGATAVKEFTPLFISNGSLKYGDVHHDTSLFGVSQSYQEVVNQWVGHGRFFTPLDEETKKRVCVVGAEVARVMRLPQGGAPLIQVDGTTFTVVGQMEKRGGSIGNDPDDVIYIPFATAAAIYGTDRMQRLPLLLQTHNRDDIDLAKEQVREILRTRHHLKKDQADDFQITTQEELMKTISTVLMTTSGVLAAVVGVALLVGGIGIMNIMLVSVTERTREIGIRKSMGARRRDVLLQFLIEAIALSALGGIVGIIGGSLLANIARLALKRFFELPPVHTPIWAILIAVGFCSILGVIFGILPAAKASKLNPIEALRYE